MDSLYVHHLWLGCSTYMYMHGAAPYIASLRIMWAGWLEPHTARAAVNRACARIVSKNNVCCKMMVSINVLYIYECQVTVFTLPLVSKIVSL